MSDPCSSTIKEIEQPTTLSIYSFVEGSFSEEFKAQWLSLTKVSLNFRAIHQTPIWCAHRARTGGESVDLFVYKRASGDLTGLSALQNTTFKLSFDIGKRSLFQKVFRAQLLLGNEPLLPECTELYDDLFRLLNKLRGDVDCLLLLGLPTDSFLFRYVTTSSEIGASYYFYMPNGRSRYYWLTLPQTFPEYLARFSSKTRHNFRWELKKLKSHGGGSLELMRIENTDQVPDFVEACTSIAANSWQSTFLNVPLSRPIDRLSCLREFADAGLLRSYLLRCGGKACAFAIGFQLGDTFTFYETAYDQSVARYSPGKVLFCSFVEDLVSYNRPERMFFGSGDLAYKDFFCDGSGEEANIVLIRRTFANWLWLRSHVLYRSLINILKYTQKRIRRKY